MPKTAKKCIESWKKYFPDFEIKEWNESNYNVNKVVYTKEAYSVKKYAFVSDYARFDILYEYGGIYFDTDVEVIKEFGDILNNSSFMGFEDIGFINPGLGIGTNKQNPILLEIIKYYNKKCFIKKNGSYDLTVIGTIVSKILKKYGKKDDNVIQDIAGVKLYPVEYFSPKSFETGLINITDNTRSIHHFDGSWCSDNDHKYIIERWNFYKKYEYDDYIINLQKKVNYLETKNIDNYSLKTLYKYIINKTIKKIHEKAF